MRRDDREDDAVRDLDDFSGLITLDGAEAGALEARVLLPLAVERPGGQGDLETELVEGLGFGVLALVLVSRGEGGEAGALLAVAVGLAAVLAGAAGDLDLVGDERHDHLEQFLSREVAAGLDVFVFGGLEGVAGVLHDLGEVIELTLTADNRDRLDAVLRIAGDGDLGDEALVLGDDELEVHAGKGGQFLSGLVAHELDAFREELLDHALGLGAVDDRGVHEDQLAGILVPVALFGHDGEATVEHVEVGGVVLERLLDGTVNLGGVHRLGDIAANVIVRVDVDDLVDGNHTRVDGAHSALILVDGEVADEEHFDARVCRVSVAGGRFVVLHGSSVFLVSLM